MGRMLMSIIYSIPHPHQDNHLAISTGATGLSVMTLEIVQELVVELQQPEEQIITSLNSQERSPLVIQVSLMMEMLELNVKNNTVDQESYEYIMDGIRKKLNQLDTNIKHLLK